MPPVSQEKLETTTDKRLPRDDASLILGIPKQFHKKATGVLKLITNHPSVSVDGGGTLAIDGKPLKSNPVSDLINKAVNPNYSRGKLDDWTQFSHLLHKLNVPKSLLSKTSDINRDRSPSISRTIKSPKRTTVNTRSSRKKWQSY